MIVSRIGITILLALALGLGVLVAIDRPPVVHAVDRALAPGLDPATVLELAWRQPDGTQFVVAREAPARPWVWRGATGGIDAARIDGVLTALRGARWQRRRSAPVSVTSATTLAVRTTRSITPLTLQIGAPGAGQTWIVRDGAPLLVDDWVARALTPTRVELRERTPLEQWHNATRVVVRRVDPPLEIDLDRDLRRASSAGRYFVREALVAALTDALAQLTLVALPTRTPSTAVAVDIELGLANPMRVAVHAACTAEACECPAATVAITGTSGDGCVAVAQVAALAAAIDPFAGPRLGHVELRPIPFVPQDYVTDDDRSLQLTGAPLLRIPPSPVLPDRARVSALVEALRTPGELVPLPAGPPRFVREISDLDSRNTYLQGFAGNVVARTGEGVAIRISPEAHGLLALDLVAFRDPSLWIEEPTAIRALTLREGTVVAKRALRTLALTRGEVIGEWRAAGVAVSPDRAAIIEELVTLLAAPRALAAAPAAPFVRKHQLVLEIAPFEAGGTASTLRGVDLGRLDAQGCPLRSDVSAPAMVTRRLCELVQRLLPLP